MKIFHYLLIPILLSVCGIQSTAMNLGKHRQACPMESLANKITKQVAKQSKKEDGLYPFGGGGQVHDTIKMLALSFRYHKALTVDEGRIVIIKAADRFLAALNENKEIRPYLNNYPFKPENIEVDIYIQKPNGEHIDSSNPIIISTRRGIVNYKINNEKTNRLTLIHSETYEEAKQIIAQTSQE